MLNMTAANRRDEGHAGRSGLDAKAVRDHPHRRFYGQWRSAVAETALQAGLEAGLTVNDIMKFRFISLRLRRLSPRLERPGHADECP
ncbi:MAG: hypothetical protein R3F40_14320 [Candidatus Competibacteraceae bacterium]